MCYVDMWYWGDGNYEGAFICKCVCVFVSLNACICSIFLYSNLVLEPCDEVYYEGYEEFIWVLCIGRMVVGYG